MDYDVVIIGGGSAGYAAARTAQDAKAKVAIIDHGPLGGLCILRGCMPTKTILRSSDLRMVLVGKNAIDLLQECCREFNLTEEECQAL